MPSPVGHALGGIIAGWLVKGRPVGRISAGVRVGSPEEPPTRRWSSWAPAAAWFGLLGALPDGDLFVGAHSQYTHSIGAALLVALLTAVSRAGPRLTAAVTAAYASHILLDWLGSDTSPPIGVMALWPFASGYYESSLHVFMAVSRQYWLGWEFWTGNLRAIAWELALLGPVAYVAWRWRIRRD